MKVKIFFLDGRISEQDTSVLYNTGTIPKDAPYTWEAMLCADDLKDGLWIRCRSCNNAITEKRMGHAAPIVSWEDRFDYQILDIDELKEVGRVEVDGTTILWRVGVDGTLVNSVKFKMQSDMFASQSSDMAINEQAVTLWRALVGQDGATPIISRNEGESQTDYERRVAETMGWDYATLSKFIQRDRELLEEANIINDSIDQELDEYSNTRSDYSFEYED